MGVKLGDSVQDRMTGFKGVAVGVTEWLYGCRRIAVQSVELKDGKPIEPEWFDEQRLTDNPAATSGGPKSDPASRRDPAR